MWRINNDYYRFKPYKRVKRFYIKKRGKGYNERKEYQCVRQVYIKNIN